MSEQTMTVSEVLAVLDQAVRMQAIFASDEPNWVAVRAAVAELAQKNDDLRRVADMAFVTLGETKIERDALRRRVEELEAKLQDASWVRARKLAQKITRKTT